MLRMTGRFVRLALAALAAYGCGSSGAYVAGVQLNGTMNVSDFVVPAGQTQTVTADTVVHATGKIEIDGTLQVAPDTNLALLADGPLTISGSIIPAGSANSSKPSLLPAGVTTATAASRDTPTEPPAPVQSVIVIGGKTVFIGVLNDLASRVGITAPAGVSVFICCTDTDGGVTIADSIAGGDGRDGAGLIPKSTDAYYAGFPAPAQAGGDVQIGTPLAMAAAAAKVNHVFPPSSIVITGTVKSGKGGRGQDAVLLSADAKGNGVCKAAGVQATDAAYANSSGGDGGSVYLDTNGTIDFSKGTVQSGSGGAAGNCGTEQTPIGPPAAAPGKPGINTDVFISRGGRRHALAWAKFGTGNWTPIASGKAGNRGDPGSDWITAANGGPGAAASGATPAIAPGAGGSVMLARIGAVSQPDTSPPPQLRDPPAASVHVTGGNGGSAADPNSNGGAGGTISVVAGFNPVYGSLQIINFGNGGSGFSGCSSTPITSGGSGGDAGTVPDKPEHTALALSGATLEDGTPLKPLITGSFNGGDAGPGALGGTLHAIGGAGGLDDSGNKIGKDGAATRDCSTAGYTVVGMQAATKINDYGSVVGLSNGTPFLQVPTTPRGTTFTAISSLNSNLPQYTPLAINSNGTVLSTSSGSAVWIPNSPNTTTGTVTDFRSISFGGYGLNDSGAVVGNFAIWRPDGSITAISFGASGGPIAMNNSGQITGTYTAIVDGTETTVGFRTAAYTSLNPSTDLLNPLTGGRITDAPLLYGHSINAAGDCIGDSGGTGIGTWHAVLWSAGSSAAKDLGTLGGDESDAAAINDARDVVGFSYASPGQNSTNSVQPRAFICPAGGAMLDLNTLIDPNSGWVLTSATDINNYGEIVGRGTNASGATFFLLVPKNLSRSAALQTTHVRSLRTRRLP